MAGFSFRQPKRIETFFCSCGKKCTPVLVAKNSHAKKAGIPTGMMWQCEGGHRERTFASRETKGG